MNYSDKPAQLQLMLVQAWNTCGCQRYTSPSCSLLLALTLGPSMDLIGANRLEVLLEVLLESGKVVMHAPGRTRPLYHTL